MPEFAAQVRALGYTDADLMQATWAEQYQATPVDAVYKDLLANNEFRSRLRAASDSGELRDRARLRSAKPIEFLYQMVAVDAPEAALCSKISPNATFDDSGWCRCAAAVPVLSVYRVQHARHQPVRTAARRRLVSTHQRALRLSRELPKNRGDL